MAKKENKLRNWLKSLVSGVRFVMTLNFCIPEYKCRQKRQNIQKKTMPIKNFDYRRC